MRPHTQGLVAINLAAVIFGTAALYGKLPVAPAWIVAMRAVFASAALALLILLRGSWSADVRTHLPTLVKTGAVLCVHWVTFFLSVQQAGVAVATLTFACYPFFTVLLESVSARRWPHGADLVAGMGIVAAVFLLVDLGKPEDHLAAGTFSGLFSALMFAWFGIACKGVAGKLSPLVVSLMQNAIVAALLLPFLPFVDNAPSTPAHWFWLLMLGLVTTALMHQLYLFALQRLSASTCSAFVALEPVYAISFASLLFGETLTMSVVLSGLLILGSALVLLRREAAGR